MIRTICRSVGLVFLVVGASELSSQADDYIPMCGVRVAIGQNQQEVSDQLARRCNVTNIDTERRLLFLTEKGDGEALTSSVFFSGGKVTRASRDWTASRPEASDLVEGLYFAARHFAEEGRTDCVIHPDLSDYLGVTTKGLTITCGRKEIVVHVLMQKDKRLTSSVYEQLR